MEGVFAVIDVVGSGVGLAGEKKQLQWPWVWTSSSAYFRSSLSGNDLNSSSNFASSGR